MLNPCFPSTVILFPIWPGVEALALFKVVDVVAGVRFAGWPGVGAVAMDLAVQPFAEEMATVRPGESPDAGYGVVEESSLVERTIGPGVYPVAMF